MEVDTFWGLSPAGWNAVTALLTAGLLLVAVVAALYAAKQVAIARSQGADARQAQIEASRPYVIISVEQSRVSQHLFDLVVRNIGQRPALNVSITLDPPPVRAEETAGHELANAKMLTTPIAMIAPGQELRSFYDSHIDRRDRDDLPTSHHATVAYRDSSGHLYSDINEIDLEAEKGTMFATVKTVHDIGKALGEIQKTLQGASLLGRHGFVEVDASVEPHIDRRERIEQERAESAQRHKENVRRLLPVPQDSQQPQGFESETPSAPG